MSFVSRAASSTIPLGILIVIHLLPLPGVFGKEVLERLYGFRIIESPASSQQQKHLDGDEDDDDNYQERTRKRRATTTTAAKALV